MKTIKTARGRTIDMGALRAKHENTRAISNMPINAKGDIIDSRGKIVVPRETISKEFYKNNVPGSTDTKVSIKEDQEEVVKVEEEIEVTQPPVEEAPIASENNDEVIEVSRRQRTREDGSEYWEVEYSDGSMEIEEE